jgi:hypothetical protein
MNVTFNRHATVKSVRENQTKGQVNLIMWNIGYHTASLLRVNSLSRAHLTAHYKRAGVQLTYDRQTQLIAAGTVAPQGKGHPDTKVPGPVG